MVVIESKLQEIVNKSLGLGSHKSIDDGLCVMEAVSYVAGEPWSDQPACACPVIASFMRSWNDSLRSDAERDRLLKSLIPQLVDTRSTAEVEKRRSYLALDWLLRVFTPKWLDMVPVLHEQAIMLRGLEEIADLAGAVAAGDKVRAAGDAAWAAAGDASWTWDASWDASWAAARAAARAAAGDAAGDALKPTTEWLQASATNLVERMIAVTPSN